MTGGEVAGGVPRKSSVNSPGSPLDDGGLATGLGSAPSAGEEGGASGVLTTACCAAAGGSALWKSCVNSPGPDPAGAFDEKGGGPAGAREGEIGGTDGAIKGAAGDTGAV